MCDYCVWRRLAGCLWCVYVWGRGYLSADWTVRYRWGGRRSCSSLSACCLHLRQICRVRPSFVPPLPLSLLVNRTADERDQGTAARRRDSQTAIAFTSYVQLRRRTREIHTHHTYTRTHVHTCIPCRQISAILVHTSTVGTAAVYHLYNGMHLPDRVTIGDRSQSRTKGAWASSYANCICG
jgi:hypothetical protein